MNNLSSYCGLVDAKIRASDKDLPVWMTPGSLLQHHRLKLERQECNCFSGVDFHEQNRTKSY